jgi:hypothetical protein
MKLRGLFLFLLLPAVSSSVVNAAGFTEPPITFYGKVAQTSNGYDLLLTSGQLAWTIQPNGGTPFVITTALSPIGIGLSYRLLIPVEKVPAGFSLSAATIPTSSSSLNYDRTTAKLNGTPLTISSPALPGGATLTYAENQRGKIERVDLQLNAAFLDTDMDGLPDWWETQFGFDPTDPGDGAADDDGDGSTNAQEYGAGTNPHDPNDSLRIIVIVKPTGVQITWTSVPGRRYQVYFVDGLDATFNLLSDVITADAGQMTKDYLDTTTVGAQRFYKVVVVP